MRATRTAKGRQFKGQGLITHETMNCQRRCTRDAVALTSARRPLSVRVTSFKGTTVTPTLNAYPRSVTSIAISAFKPRGVPVPPLQRQQYPRLPQQETKRRPLMQRRDLPKHQLCIKIVTKELNRQAQHRGLLSMIRPSDFRSKTLSL